LKRYDVRGTLEYVEKGCRAAANCSDDMYIWFNGFCDTTDCVQCINDPYNCYGPKGKHLCM